MTGEAIVRGAISVDPPVPAGTAGEMPPCRALTLHYRRGCRTAHQITPTWDAVATVEEVVADLRAFVERLAVTPDGTRRVFRNAVWVTDRDGEWRVRVHGGEVAIGQVRRAR